VACSRREDVAMVGAKTVKGGDDFFTTKRRKKESQRQRRQKKGDIVGGRGLAGVTTKHLWALAVLKG